MKKTNTSVFRLSTIITFLFYFLLLPLQLVGQCGAPDPLPTPDCENAPLICLNEWCYQTIDQQNPGWNNYCGPNTIVNNPQFYEIVATEENIYIQINVGSCTGGQNSMQAALILDCPWDIGDVIDCNPGSVEGHPFVLQSGGHEIGQSMWLMIDGSAGSKCDYLIEQTQGIYAPEIVGDITSITASQTSVVQGMDLLTLEASPPIQFAHGFYWIPGWGSDQDTIITPFPNLEIYVPCDVPPGIYSICARGYSGCDITDSEACIDIEVLPLLDVIKTPSTLCAEQFPFFWSNTVITGPGLYTQTFFTEGGCPYDSIWMIDTYPDFQDGIIDTLVCSPEFFYEGQWYDQSGTYDLFYPGLGHNGCDSMAQLILELQGNEIFIEHQCADSISVLVPHSILPIPPGDTLFYEWYTCDFDTLLSTDQSYFPDTTGCYCLVAENGYCSDTICSTYILDPCLSDCSLTKDTSCAGESILFYYGEEASSEAQFHWLIDLQGAPDSYILGHRSMVHQYSEAGWYHVSLTVTDSFSTVTCSDSFYIRGYTSEASIVHDGSDCGLCTDLTIQLTGASPWILYIGNNFQPDTIYNVTSSTYTYTTCPPADSISIYSLTVTDSFNQCKANILVNQPLFLVLHPDADASMTVFEETLCGTYAEDASYMWFTCQENEFLSTDLCFNPDTSGCYCLEVTNASGCSDTTCFDFIISSIPIVEESEINIYPNPSKGTLDVNIKPSISLPIAWTLTDVFGRTIENGSLDKHHSTIRLKQVPSPGLYYLTTISADHQTMTSKLIFEAK